MTPEVKPQIKDRIWERMRERLGDEYLAEHTGFLEAQWEWAKQLGMVDPEVELDRFLATGASAVGVRGDEAIDQRVFPSGCLGSLDPSQ